MKKKKLEKREFNLNYGNATTVLWKILVKAMAFEKIEA